MLADDDRIFTNLYGLHDPFLNGARARGDWDGTKHQDAARKGVSLLDVAVPQGRGHIRSRSPWKGGREKPTADERCDRTKTDRPSGAARLRFASRAGPSPNFRS
jgi:hypothetical protein